jgi:hypothetical protein
MLLQLFDEVADLHFRFGSESRRTGEDDAGLRDGEGFAEGEEDVFAGVQEDAGIATDLAGAGAAFERDGGELDAVLDFLEGIEGDSFYFSGGFRALEKATNSPQLIVVGGHGRKRESNAASRRPIIVYMRARIW